MGEISLIIANENPAEFQWVAAPQELVEDEAGATSSPVALPLPTLAPTIIIPPTATPSPASDWRLIAEENFPSDNPRGWMVGQRQGARGTQTCFVTEDGYDVKLHSTQSWMLTMYPPQDSIEVGPEFRIEGEISYFGEGNCGLVFSSDRTNSFYMFTVEESGAALFRHTHSGWIVVGQKDLPVRGERHTLVVEVKNKVLCCYLDSDLLFETSVLQGGEIGLAVGLYEAGQDGGSSFTT